ncbi:hypothetical protein VaNZ11_015811 [Volvox africanus]|uniref:Uncharacterized protein n=1 Tax=Volvox africanus TaxID=51714 RepID=A0ABQ5SN01_9CHLO|nr:hypothetical protein VaNZ11_015811 [Volvox africanus]
MPFLKQWALLGWTDLHAAAAAGDIAKVQRAVQKNSQDLERLSREGQSPLHLAAANGFDVVVRELLARQAKTTVQDKAGRTPLHLAAAAGHAGCVRELLGRNNRDSREVKEYLLFQKDKEGNDALMAAVVAGREAAVKELVQVLGEQGVRRCTDKCGHGPVHVAVELHHVHLLPLLVAATGGPDKERDAATGATALHTAARLGLQPAIDVLLRHGASSTTLDNAGRTASETALAAGQHAAYRALREAFQPSTAPVGTGTAAPPPGVSVYDHRLIHTSAEPAANVAASDPSTAGGGTAPPYGRLQIPAELPPAVLYPKTPEGAGVYF